MEDNGCSIREMLIKIIEEDFDIKRENIVKSSNFDFDSISSAVYTALRNVLKRSKYIIKNKRGKAEYRIDDRGKELIKTLFYSVIDIKDSTNNNQNNLPQCNEFYTNYKDNTVILLRTYMAKIQYNCFMQCPNKKEFNYFNGIFIEKIQNFVISNNEFAKIKKNVIKIRKEYKCPYKTSASKNEEIYKKIKNIKINPPTEGWFEKRIDTMVLKLKTQYRNNKAPSVRFDDKMLYICRNEGYEYFNKFKEFVDFDSLIKSRKTITDYIDKHEEINADGFIKSIALCYVTDFIEFYNYCVINNKIVNSINLRRKNYKKLPFSNNKVNYKKPSQLSEIDKNEMICDAFVLFNEEYFDEIIDKFIYSADSMLYDDMKKLYESQRSNN